MPNAKDVLQCKWQGRWWHVGYDNVPGQHPLGFDHLLGQTQRTLTQRTVVFAQKDVSFDPKDSGAGTLTSFSRPPLGFNPYMYSMVVPLSAYVTQRTVTQKTLKAGWLAGT